MGENKRVRIGTTALGVGSLVWAILFFWKGLRVCLFLGSSFLFASLSPDSFATVPSNISLLCFIPYVLLPLLFIAAGIGVLFRQNWGRKLFLGLGIYLIIQPLVSFLVFGFFTNTIWVAVELGFAGLILWYFHKRSIAFHFGSSEEELGRERWKHFAVAVFFILLLIGGYLFFVSSHGLDQVWQQAEVKKIN